MANIDIKAIYMDMASCANAIESIGQDVAIGYQDIESFLKEKMVFNGKEIYKNWQSDARALFSERIQTVLDTFKGVQKECAEASATLRAAMKKYEESDSTISADVKKTSVGALDFTHFGAIASAKWTASGSASPGYIANATKDMTKFDVKETPLTAAEVKKANDEKGIKYEYLNKGASEHGGKGWSEAYGQLPAMGAIPVVKPGGQYVTFGDIPPRYRDYVCNKTGDPNDPKNQKPAPTQTT